MAEADASPCIYVIAGTNGAGKSSIAGAMFRQGGAETFDPDEAAQRILSANPGWTQDEANSAAWHQGVRLLRDAIEHGSTYAFESTLGGRTITALLQQGLDRGRRVRIWYAGLAGPDLHVARVRARVARGGHDISERTIRERFDTSRLNLIRLLPRATEVRVYDNSREADPAEGIPPEPVLILHTVRGKVVETCDLAATPGWAKPIMATVLRF